MAMLVVALLATVAYIVVMGIRQWLRARTLSRLAGELQLRFTREDPFDLAESLRDFALMNSGHSCRASHVSHGRLGEMPVRAFNLRYEVGHGTRRLTRHYSVIVADLQRDLPPVLMWNQHDAENMPADIHQVDRQVGCWACTGSGILADTVKDGVTALAEEGLSVEVRGRAAMLALPGRHGPWWNYTLWLDSAKRLLETLAETACRDTREKET